MTLYKQKFKLTICCHKKYTNYKHTKWTLHFDTETKHKPGRIKLKISYYRLNKFRFRTWLFLFEISHADIQTTHLKCIQYAVLSRGVNVGQHNNIGLFKKGICRKQVKAQL